MIFLLGVQGTGSKKTRLRNSQVKTEILFESFSLAGYWAKDPFQSKKKYYLENVHSLASQVIISIDCFGTLVEHYKGIFWTPGIQSIKMKKIKSIIICTSNAGNKNYLETHSRWPGRAQHSTKKEEIKLSFQPPNFLFSQFYSPRLKLFDGIRIPEVCIAVLFYLDIVWTFIEKILINSPQVPCQLL